MRAIILTGMMFFLLSMSHCKRHYPNDIHNNSNSKMNCNMSLLREVDDILEKMSKKYRQIFVNIYFYQKNDTSFVAISKDLYPPYIMDSSCYRGFMEYGHHILVFFNDKVNCKFDEFVNIDSLNHNIQALYNLKPNDDIIYDGGKKVFFINQKDSIVYYR